jgi:mannose-6-phosphate isomerase-like protein (cupin superfamily)
MTVEILDHFEELSRSLAPVPSPGVPSGLRIDHYAQSKVVGKRWGRERWLVEYPFAMKVIEVDAGQRTSLQYHEEKEETNFVLAGTARLHYRDDNTGNVTSLDLGPGTVVHVKPRVIHRIEAVTPLLLVEASTPQLDDVVRLEDDWGRPDGRIEAEHEAGTQRPS